MTMAVLSISIACLIVWVKSPEEQKRQKVKEGIEQSQIGEACREQGEEMGLYSHPADLLYVYIALEPLL